jgi:predicted RNase H-like nuclease/ppGpp synthetase/RelA/SpoT-type nucleotidyltranferase
MHFVGVDLAWGERKPSGLAVLDEHGRLLHVSAQTTDETIEAALAPYTTGDCLVAVDAPLIVVNQTGNRPCEAELNRDFRAYEAGAHPANRARREFADIPRGARLAERLGLDIDPVSPSSRRAIEVYPHPATVALFDLPRTLKYKSKPGRTLPEMRGELVRLVELLESLEDARTRLLLRHSEEWRALRAAVTDAATKADLRRAEDQVDAVVCAYVALFATRRPRETTTYGDGATGYIVTPTLPALLPPPVAEDRAVAAAAASSQPVAPPVAPPVSEAVRQYAALQPTLETPTRRWTETITTLLDDAGINYLSVAGRTKSVASFAAKAMRAADGRPSYDDPIHDITDQVGVRVITYVHDDVAAVAQLFADLLVVLDDRDLGQETASQGRFGYASRHLLVRAPDDVDRAVHDDLGGHPASVQVRTVLQHAWAEFEHDIRYKGTIPDEHVSDLDRRFTLAAGLLELADREFSAIRDRLRAATPEPAAADPADPRISGQDLASFLTGQYADAGWSRSEHYSWIAGLLLELGITGLDELAALLGSVDTGAIIARMGYRYPAGAVRRLDDALLAIFGDRYVALHGNAHRTGLLRNRLERLSGE